jgi:hypothetical protein
MERIPVNVPKRPVPWIWTMSLPAVFTLAAGLLAGIFLTHRFEIGKKLNTPAAPSILVLSPQTETSRKPAQPISTPKEPARNVRNVSTKAAAPLPSSNSAQIPQDSSTGETSIERLIAADSALENTIQGTQASVSLDLALQSHSLIPAPLALENPVSTVELPVVSENRVVDEHELGTVRMAVDLAAKKTGAFVSKVGTSIKRVF